MSVIRFSDIFEASEFAEHSKELLDLGSTGVCSGPSAGAPVVPPDARRIDMKGGKSSCAKCFMGYSFILL